MQVRELVINYKHPKRFPDVVTKAADAVDSMRRCLPNNSREHFACLYLDGAHQPVGYTIVTSGLANASQVHPREVFQPAVLRGACAIICFHNHPSGSVVPSAHDREVTRKLRAAAEIMAIPILDHIILSDTEYHSMSEHGEL